MPIPTSRTQGLPTAPVVLYLFVPGLHRPKGAYALRRGPPKTATSPHSLVALVAMMTGLGEGKPVAPSCLDALGTPSTWGHRRPLPNDPKRNVETAAIHREQTAA
jgi:hypothetical protein